ncbi:NarK family nitrate/nitrite MFS transporter [Alloalcanivorax profundimaris]|uniref:NarK family nitrate/nitrite MFS transporter n=1 Tax=Alloalcanivorax profundimaris TaxID=2735259 RepID=UPI00136CA5A8|nr:NarK family nitrate/nitrite MFS transporter [Alloalcanivorax profundimaris]MBF1800533.1 NarK family nitrate/nitrite MFS transporter [Alloalcanivorax profundimaris]MBM1144019.1 NarK family nitrate/nitrite MFS transporter [Alcanivorax sp. ZXX171]
MSSTGLNPLAFSQSRIRLLHLSWLAFFITFMVWFAHAPMMSTIREAFSLTDEQVKALLILNVALTIPARVVIGSLVDRFGPRRVFGVLLILAAVPCWLFAFAQTYQQLAITRLALGFVGAGFVVGIRLIGEWFPAREVGLAEGMYGGWGNFGSAAASMSLPTVAVLFGGDDGWRWAIASTGLVALLYGLVFLWRARDTPKGSAYFKPKRTGALEVTSRRDLIFYLAMSVPLYGALLVILWRLGPGNLNLFGAGAQLAMGTVVLALALAQLWQAWRVNRERLAEGVAERDRYAFKQVAILDLAYMVTFGSELAVVSMLPLFFTDTFGLEPVTAGLLAAGYAFMNLVARPGGGWLSDRFGRKKALALLIAGLVVGYFVLSRVNEGWPLVLAVLATMGCSFFVQAGEGAVFATVPLIKRRLTGQIAGMVGAYGNAGAVLFLTVLTFVDASTFFLVIAGAALVTLLAVRFLEEPHGHIAEVDDQGRVQLIEVG